MMDALVDVRPAADADREPIMALASRLAEGVAGWRDPAAAARAAEGWLADSLAAAARGGTTGVFVAVRGAEVVGVVSVEEQRHFTGAVDAYVGESAVASEAARRGVGRLLMAAAEEWARSRGLRRLSLRTGAANTAARRFYEALGYEPEEVRLTRVLPSGF